MTLGGTAIVRRDLWWLGEPPTAQDTGTAGQQRENGGGGLGHGGYVQPREIAGAGTLVECQPIGGVNIRLQQGVTQAGCWNVCQRAIQNGDREALGSEACSDHLGQRQIKAKSTSGAKRLVELIELTAVGQSDPGGDAATDSAEPAGGTNRSGTTAKGEVADNCGVVVEGVAGVQLEVHRVGCGAQIGGQRERRGVDGYMIDSGLTGGGG